MSTRLQATKGDKSIGIEELSDDVFCKLLHSTFKPKTHICLSFKADFCMNTMLQIIPLTYL